MSKKIKVKIDGDNVSIEVEGMEGTACRDITRAFESALGTVTEVQEKPEYFVELEGQEIHCTESED